MKAILICLLLGLALSYDAQAAVNYANTYCRNYNRNYASYKNSGGDCANFVSQCMHAGGIDFSGCQNVNRQVMIPGCTSLKRCLRSRGRTEYSSMPANFKAGYPVFRTKYAHTLLVVGFKGNQLLVDAHTTDRCGDAIDKKDLVYYSL